MAYAIKKGSDYFNTVTYTGTGASRDITVGFSPDLVWVKNRTSAYQHQVSDSVRGTSKVIYPSATTAEASDPNAVTAFLSDGFTYGSSVNGNESSASIVAWNWKGGESTVENTDGSITSQVSANPTSGFSVVKWTGTGSAGTIGHGLSATPQFIIVKNLTYGVNWRVYHVASGGTKYYSFNLNNAEGTSSLPWNNTAPTSSVFSVGTEDNTNRSSDEFVAYVWAPVAGYSKFGYYEGNSNADGTFVYTGFRPQFFMMKPIDTANSWILLDTARDGESNTIDLRLLANTTDAENNSPTGYVDFYSNGFKLRYNGAYNSSSYDYLYMAIGSTPFKYANAL